MAEVQRCWPSGQTDSGRHYREQGERRERKMKKTDDAHFKPTHKHGIKSIQCCGSTHNRTACEFRAHARFPCKMHETHNKTCQKIWAEPHMLFHFVSRAGERANRWAVRQSLFFAFLVVAGVWLGTQLCSLLKGGHRSAESKTFEVSEAPFSVPH